VKQFIEDHFDKLLLGCMLMYLVHVVLFLSMRQTAPEVISWARELTSGFAGGLLGLITGMRIQNGGSDVKSRLSVSKIDNQKQEKGSEDREGVN